MMNKWSVLIIDDEMPAREMIKNLLDWNETGFEIVESLKNGLEGLRYYKENPVDLIITDIQMPLLNGLDLIKEIKKINPNQQFMILSCHEQFSYAQEAIRLGVRDYLIKDLISETEMLTSLSSIKSNLEKMKSSPISNLRKQEIFKKILKSGSYFNELISNKDVIMDNFNFGFKHKVLMVIWVDGLYEEKLMGDIRANYFYSKIMTAIRSSLQDSESEVFNNGNNEYVVVTELSQTTSRMKYFNECQNISSRIRSFLKDVLPNDITIGISDGFIDIEELRSKYDDAVKACKQRVFLGYGRNIFSDDMFSKSRAINPEILDEKINKVKAYMINENKENAKSEIESIFRVELRGIMQYNYLRYVNMKLFSIYTNYIELREISLLDILGTQFIPVGKLDLMQTIDEMLEFWSKLLDQLCTSSVPGRDTEVFSLKVNQAIKIIRENYRSGISLSDIADELEVHKVYLSRIFKQETGHTISQYVQSLIMDDAKHMLANTNMKINEISEKVGYKQSQQFTFMFKKMFGMTPHKFRKKHSTI